MEIPNGGLYLIAKSESNKDKNIIHATCKLRNPIEIKGQDDGIEIAVVYFILSGNWPKLTDLSMIVSNVAGDSYQTIEIDDVYSTNETAVLSVIRNKLESVFGTKDPDLKLTRTTSSQKAKFHLKRQMKVIFSEGMQKVFGLEEAYANKSSSRQQQIPIEYQIPESTPFDTLYFVKCPQIRPSFVHDLGNDRILDIASVYFDTSGKLEWHASLQKYTRLEGVRHEKLDILLYKAQDNRPKQLEDTSFFVLLHLRRV